MVVAWIVITLMLALLVAVIAAGIADFEKGTVFVGAFIIVCQLSFAIAVIYVAAHFIGKYW
jgi:hypothetical protein